jgi:pimeloyl-ACP methyl ester carboxylesterase
MTNKSCIRSIFLIFSICTLVACGGGGEDTPEAIPTPTPPPQPSTQSHSVTVIDGYLRSATVWLDLNNNGIQDTDEPTAETTEKGKATLTLAADINPQSYSVLVYAKAGVSFDESLNQYVEKDFFLASPKGEVIITPFTTLVYLKEREVGNIDNAKSLVGAQLGLSSSHLYQDFIAMADENQEALAADLVRLSLMPTSAENFVNLLSDSEVYFSDVAKYIELSINDDKQIRVMRDTSGLLSRDTDIDNIADTDDPDIDGDNVLNENDVFIYNPNEWEDLDGDGVGNNSDTDIDGDGILNDNDDNPLIAEFNTIKNPGEIIISERVSGVINLDEWQYFTVESPADVMLNISLTGLSDDVDLYVRQGEAPTKFDYKCRSNLANTESEVCVERAKEVKTYYIGLLARQNANYELVVEAEPIVYQKVMLLLHGLASSPSTWNAMINDDSFFNGSCQTLTVDEEALNESQTNSKGVSCFNIEFGAFDRGSDFSVTGLDNKTCNNVLGCDGDYTTFDGLGYEVEAAITRIVEHLGQDIEVFMFGHSRGGLAARSFLQNDLLTNRSLIKGFATTGTPHQGSPLGRFYQYMHDNCIPKSVYRQDGSRCEDNWEVIEMLQGTRKFLGYNYSRKYQMDLQSPSVDFLSPDSSAIKSLNENLNRLNNMIIGQLSYEGTVFGVLSKDPGYDLYDYGTWFAGDHPHPDTLRYIENGQTRASLLGDGIVPSNSQKLSLLLAESGITITAQGSQNTTNILHVEETSRVSDINWLFDRLYPDLGWN